MISRDAFTVAARSSATSQNTPPCNSYHGKIRRDIDRKKVMVTERLNITYYGRKQIFLIFTLQFVVTYLRKKKLEQ